jgi:hypothetical protein
MPIDPRTGQQIPYYGYGAGPGGPPQMPGMPPRPQGQPQQAQQTMPGLPQPPQAGQPDQSRLLEEALLGTYGDVMENDSLGEQLARAEALRNVAAPEMRGNGRVQTAANPMEFIGRGITQYRQGRKMQDIEGRQGAARGRIGEAVKKYGLNLPE